MTQVIHVELDGIQFARVRLALSSTVAELRITLLNEHRPPSHTYFLDTRGYRLSKEDENIDKIEQLLDANDTVIMESVGDIPKRRTSANTADMRKERQGFINKYSAIIITEILSILSWLWSLLLKPMMIMALISLAVYFSYTKVVCHYGRFLPLVTRYCPIDPLESITLPPVSKLAENSASLADALMNADVSAPMRFVQAKVSLVQLRAQVMYSDIDVSVREKLSKEILQLQQLVQAGADHLTIMLTSFGGTLDKVRIYTQFALEDLSKVINPGKHSNNNRLQLGYSEMEAKNMLTESFENYMASVAEQTDKILLKAQQAHMSLEVIKEKLETIQELSFKGKYISQARIDELKHGPFWSWLFDEGKLGILKHERSLKTLNEFIRFVTTASINVNDMIIKLKIFKADAEDLKQSITLLEELPHISVNRHAQLLEAALKRLTESKEKFDGKLQKANQQVEFE